VVVREAPGLLDWELRFKRLMELIRWYCTHDLEKEDIIYTWNEIRYEISTLRKIYLDTKEALVRAGRTSFS